jgi:5-methylcytosine-specific restriction endonuclease McrA
LRRYNALRGSYTGERVPSAIRRAVYDRDRTCVGRGRLPGDCFGGLELDHVRASHGIGMKSETALDNLVALCSSHHRYKTEHGREARPILLEYLNGRG